MVSFSPSESVSGRNPRGHTEPVRQHAGRLPEAGGCSGGAAGPAESRPGAPATRVPDSAGYQDQTGDGDCRVQEAAGRRDVWVSVPVRAAEKHSLKLV